MSLNSIKRDLKDYIEENKALLEAWERVTYLTKKDGTPFKSMSKNFNNAIYKRKESFRGYILEVDTKSVSYTHLDVYKRQTHVVVTFYR